MTRWRDRANDRWEPCLFFPWILTWLQKDTQRYFNLVGSFFLNLDYHLQNYKSWHLQGLKHGRICNTTDEKATFSPAIPVHSRWTSILIWVRLTSLKRCRPLPLHSLPPYHLPLPLFIFKEEPLLRVNSGSSACLWHKLNWLSLSDLWSLQRSKTKGCGLCSQWSQPEISLHKQAAGSVREYCSFHSAGNRTRFLLCPGFAKTFLYNEMKALPWSQCFLWGKHKAEIWLTLQPRFHWA